jgi:hypothetical protein
VDEDLGQASHDYYSLRRVFAELEWLSSAGGGADEVVDLLVVHFHVGAKDAPLRLGSSVGWQGVLALLNGGENVDERLGNHAGDGGGVTRGGGGAAHHGKGFAFVGMEERSSEIWVLAGLYCFPFFLALYFLSSLAPNSLLLPLRTGARCTICKD